MSPPSPEAVQFAKSAINEAMDILQRRWTLRLLWELKASALTFRALQAQCGEVSPSVLNQRLAENCERRGWWSAGGRLRADADGCRTHHGVFTAHGLGGAVEAVAQAPAA